MGAKVINLFQRDKPPTEDPDFWEWGQDFVEDGVTNLEMIVYDISHATTEDALRRALTELKAEVESYPI